MSRIWMLGLVVVVGFAGCTAPNPRSCADGTCTDPALPFCDVDGALEGSPNTCIAVSCVPEELVACRGDLAITCNAIGTDYDLVQCERGCDVAAGGCQACSSDDQCANPSPVCDVGAGSCRGCQADGECGSGICDSDGTCVPETSVVYAAPAGVDTGSCSQAAPCSLERAVTVATTAAVTPFLRLLPGSFATVLEVGTPTPSPLRVVATGAVLGLTSGLVVTEGASVEIRGVDIRSDQNMGREVVCGSPDPLMPISRLVIRESTIAPTAPSAMIKAARCTLSVFASEFPITVAGGVVSLSDDTMFDGDRLHMRPATPAASILRPINALGKRMTLRLTNSILEDVYLAFNATDTVAPGSLAVVGFNTFLFTRPDAEEYCELSASVRETRFENNIFLGTASTNVVRGAGCTFSNNVLFPQPAGRVNNLIADPLFVDLAGKDLRLQAASPAVNAAVPSTGLSTDHDFAGTARPQGSAPDIGALERLP